MPYLVDEGPPVDAATLQAARNELPREYGVRVVMQRGRKVVLVRVPRAKPDYNYELAVVAFYVTPDDVKDARDVVLVGDERSVRMEPIRLRDHVREQMREDTEVMPQIRARVAREYGWTTFTSPLNHHNKALVLRLPLGSVAEADDAILLRARASVGTELVPALRETHYVYLVADDDFGRLGRRVFVEGVASDLATAVAPRESSTANPLHLGFQTPGGFLDKVSLPRP